MRQLFFSHVIFLRLSEALVIFNISSPHVNPNLSNRYFSPETFLISKYSKILRVLLDPQWHVLEFNIQSFLQDSQSSNFLHSHRHSSWFHFCLELHTFSFNPYLHSHDSCWTKSLVSFTPQHYIQIFFFAWKINSSIRIINSVTTSTTRVNTISKSIKNSFTRVYIINCRSSLASLIV